MQSKLCMAAAVGALTLVGACDLFTGPDARVLGVIGVEGNRYRSPESSAA